MRSIFEFPLAILFLLTAFAQHPGPLPIPNGIPEQQPPESGKPRPVETWVSGHRIGETFEEWLTINRLDLADICRKHTRSEPKTMDFKAVCERLKGIRSTGRGDFFLGDEAVKQAFQWVFMDGRLAEVSTEYPRPDTEQQITFLKQAYGPPTNTETATYQNAYGAKWDCLQVRWDMPDGAMILASESVKNLPEPVRWLTVTFVSRGRIDEAGRQNQKPNPYVR